ncbi:hypothetical protein BH23ACT12_BH23ACT12_12540 [soil metagenome]
MTEGEGPTGRWVREYNAQLMSLDQLADKIAGHQFQERKREDEQPTMGRALDYKDDDYEPGSFDEVYRARAFGLLTKHDMQIILDRVEQARK